MNLLPLFILTLGILSWGYAYPAVFLFVLFLKPRIEGRKIYFNFLFSSSFWILMITSITYVAIGSRSLNSAYHHIVLPVFAFAIGWTIAENESEKNILDSILALASGYGVYASLNSLVNVGHNRYTLIDFWTRSTRAATGSGSLNTMVVSLPTYFLGVEKRKSVKRLFSVLFILSLIYMFMLGTRTQFLIFFVTAIIGIYILSYQKYGIREILKSTLVLAVVVGIAFALYKFNVFSVQDIIKKTNLAARYTNQTSLDNSDARRVQAFIDGVTELFKYPLGGRSAQLYRHNMWLDVGRVAGLLPFTTLVLYTFTNIKTLIDIYREKCVMKELRYVLLFVYIGIYINCFVEPVWEGLWNFFLSVCVIDGMIGAIKRRMDL